MKRCKNCGYIGESKFCPECGGRMEEERISDNTALEQKQEITTEPEFPPKEERIFKGRKKIIIFVAIIVVILLVIFLITRGSRNKGIDVNEFAEFEFPTKGIATLLPVPESNIGKIEWDNADSFNLYVGETSHDDYKEYVESCSDAGFDVDYQSGEDHYFAYDSQGNDLDIWYLENNVMHISIEAADDGEETEEVSEEVVEENSAENGFVNAENLPTELEFGFVDYTEFSEYWFDGTFRCGTDFEAGDYYILPLFGAGAIYEVSDSPDEFSWSNYRMIRKITVEDGQYVNVANGAIMVQAEEIDTDNWSKYGVYLVGKDILAGEYKIETISDEYSSELYSITGVDGAYQLNEENIDDEPINCNYLFESQGYITLENGQYLIITNLKLTNVEVPQEKSETVADTESEDEDSKVSTSSYKNYCDASGCVREGTESFIGISGQTEYYCSTHYNEMMDMIEAMEEDVYGSYDDYDYDYDDNYGEGYGYDSSDPFYSDNDHNNDGLLTDEEWLDAMEDALDYYDSFY